MWSLFGLLAWSWPSCCCLGKEASLVQIAKVVHKHSLPLQFLPRNLLSTSEGCLASKIKDWAPRSHPLNLSPCNLCTHSLAVDVLLLASVGWQGPQAVTVFGLHPDCSWSALWLFWLYTFDCFGYTHLHCAVLRHPWPSLVMKSSVMNGSGFISDDDHRGAIMLFLKNDPRVGGSNLLFKFVLCSP